MGEFNSPPTRPRSVFGALLLLFFGIFFLLHNFDLLDWRVIRQIFPFWPVILIVGGLYLILGSSRIGQAVVLLMAVLSIALIGFLVYSDRLASPPSSSLFTKLSKVPLTAQPLETSQVTIGNQSYMSASNRNFKVNSGVGNLILDDNNSSDILKSDFRYWGSDNHPSISQSQQNDQLTIEVNTQPLNGIFFTNGQTPESHLTLGRPQLKTDIDLKVGVGTTQLNYSNIRLGNFTADFGTGNADLQFGSASLPAQSTINVGTGSVKIKVPADTGLKITYTNGVGELQIAGQKLGHQGTYTSPNYDTAPTQISFDLKIGTGSVIFE